MNKSDITKQILDGVMQAWSKRQQILQNANYDLNTPSGRKRKNEQFFSSFIAKALNERIFVESEKDFVTHETNDFLLESAIRQLAGGKVEEHPEPTSSRYDLVLWSGKNQPYAIIEVKYATRASTVMKDMFKVIEVLQRLHFEGTVGVRNVYLAVATSSSNLELFEEIGHKMMEDLIKILSESNLELPTFKPGKRPVLKTKFDCDSGNGAIVFRFSRSMLES
ncbi:MAG: hypothetical protein ABJO86_14445 [Lentilitoribacter sp.]